MNFKLIIRLAFVFLPVWLYGQKSQSFQISSPNSRIKLTVTAGPALQWSVTHQSNTIIAPTDISLRLEGGEVLGENARVLSSRTQKIHTKFAALNYKKDSVEDICNELRIRFKGDYGIIWRVYDEGVVYRFITSRKDSLVIQSEQAGFNFTADHMAYLSYVNDPHNKDDYQTSFENIYEHKRLSQIVRDTLAFAPVLVELPGGLKAAITEADLEDYPGMFLQPGPRANSLQGNFAPYPVEERQGGHNNLQSFVVKRAGYIARTSGTRSFPWRVVIISENDKDLLNNDMVYRLASPSRLTDVSWIKPGKVAWDWWNSWNISHVDFRAGINTITYKYYIDFASAHHIENILLDEGWSDPYDIMKIVPDVNLQEIIDYGKTKNVGVWLWSGWLPLDKQADLALSKYSKMGVKGFKIDFMDRDDQKIVAFYYRFAKKTAEYHLMLDFHGAYKPTGLQRTFPNVLNFEGVRGLENAKWATDMDFPFYDCAVPFIRMLAGPLDYTPGAMKNANKENFRAVYSAAMSQGTRCHQLAMYVVYEAPFAMLADNPTNYMREPESTKFIASVPTTFDETVALDGKVSEYAVLARRKGRTWYAGALSNWNERDLTIDLSFLGGGAYEAEIFQDGINADREATDYKRVVRKVSAKDKLTIHLSTGGGWVAKIYPAQ